MAITYICAEEPRVNICGIGGTWTGSYRELPGATRSYRELPSVRPTRYTATQCIALINQSVAYLEIYP
ncbi:hypothetical protein EYF80_053453 [Liparis tanakae]|uniref:Uncharacterized protein n=1 Tax=Liparis tanakae TaxID=230148 RepID=A0A4Z2F5J6_9TELE|nr:hypothetical protein EYF80_053453 [Liparis tanakae]